MTRCTAKSPPGDEIYRGKDNLCMWEVDGSKDVEYCQHLSYLAKMFLDHKSLFYSTSLFFFYVLTELDEYGYHIVGYFRYALRGDPECQHCFRQQRIFLPRSCSKEKNSEAGYNLACILALVRREFCF
jgi:hypothetical protein